MILFTTDLKRGVFMEFKIKSFSQLSAAEIYEILKARAEVFVMEQKILYNDMDGVDYESLHCFVEDGSKVIAYLRAFPEKEDESAIHIGRVLTLWHNKGFGRKLMEYFIDNIRKEANYKKLRLNSQKHAVGFYEKFGFKIVSDEFIIENIPHFTMELYM